MPSKLSENLKYLRKSRGLSQEQLAKEVGLSKHSINSYESGRREPNSKAMAILEKYFQISGEDLRGDNNDLSYIWNDNEVMEAVSETLPTLIDRLMKSAIKGSAFEQKMLFDILTELLHIFSQKDSFRTSSISLVEETLVMVTQFIDLCSNICSSSEFEDGRIEKAKLLCIESFSSSITSFKNDILYK